MKTPPHDISTDGISVWVNGDVCLGRFCAFGYDVFIKDDRTIVKHLFTGAKGSGKDNEVTVLDWRRWQTAMLEFFNINVPDEYIPRKLKEAAKSTNPAEVDHG